ncbi:cytochrome C assembly family protein [Usitatibacter palustris]|uniref:Inner membrane protein YpjD n=1 Tax=Usitatibacter palustris TaxID=2732487 RepID=A0A6M4HAN4_9PROT|nr:cytochrome c biogenesis protein CcsA [Usitatibacter palustris]QJR16636.1 Inner membrane protein YpjD [Usitatibacter palustris]
MLDSLLYISTAACWLALTGIALKQARPGHSPATLGRVVAVLFPLGLVLHAMLIYNGVMVAEGLNLGFANAVSLIVWLTALIYWLASIVYRGLSSMQGMMAPVALVAVAVQFLVPSRHIVTYTGEPLFTLHFAIAMLGYALFIVATVHAVVMLVEEKWLHKGVMPPFLRTLPPLLEMEALLFRVLLAAFVMLTLTVITGLFFSEQLFGKPLTFTHKSIFGIISWFIFGGLLVGHYAWGWRGRRAVHWTLAGFTTLLLAYVGSKFVAEIILQRG